HLPFYALPLSPMRPLFKSAVSVFFSRTREPPIYTLFPYTTLFRSMVTVCPSQFATRRTLFHVLVGCGLLMLKVSRLKLPEREKEIGRAVQQECRDRCRMPSSAGQKRDIE